MDQRPLLLDAQRITAFHDSLLDGALSAVLPAALHADGPWQGIERNHRSNIARWHEEDRARRRDATDAEIVRCRRAIDGHNQQRHEAVEAIDLALLGLLDEAGLRPLEHARLHSETPGAMIDRLSILALKIHHMQLAAARTDAGAAHALACAARHERLTVQRAELRDCLHALLVECERGSASFRPCRQFKLYGDAGPDPWMLRQAQAAHAARR